MNTSPFIHPLALCESTNVGTNTRIWAFSHVLPRAVIGDDCNICEQVFIENDVSIGHRVTIKNGVQLWDGIHVEDDVFIGPNTTFCNDKFPRSKHIPKYFLKTRLCAGSSIGSNATILPGITIGQHAMIGAGSVVIGNVPPKAIVAGNPGIIIGYVDEGDKRLVPSHSHSLSESTPNSTLPSAVTGVMLHHFPMIRDLRGNLTVGNFVSEIPFTPKRYFVVFDVPSSKIRGEHAHTSCQQFMICLRGSVAVLVDDGEASKEYILDSPTIGLLIPNRIWCSQRQYSEDCLLLIFASEPYDPNDYIRDYDQFIKMRRAL